MTTIKKPKDMVSDTKKKVVSTISLNHKDIITPRIISMVKIIRKILLRLSCFTMPIFSRKSCVMDEAVVNMYVSADDDTAE